MKPHGLVSFMLLAALAAATPAAATTADGDIVCAVDTPHFQVCVTEGTCTGVEQRVHAGDSWSRCIGIHES